MPFVIVAIVTVVLTPPTIVVARRLGLVDRPGPLKVHATAIPLAGVTVAIAAGIAVAVSDVPGRPWVLIALAIATLAGVLDDVRALGPGSRLVLQSGAGVALVVSGATLEPLGALGDVGLVLVSVAMANAVNMLDGQDGLAPGLVTIAGLGVALLASGTETPLAAAGAAAAFLLWNRSPARAFLGDGGAYALAVLLAVGAADASTAGWPGLLGAGACLGVFAYELLSTVVRRLVQRSSTVAGDRDHTYDRIAARIASRTASTYVMWAAGAIASAIGLVISRAPAAAGVALTVVATAIAALIHVRLSALVSEGER